MSMYRIKSGIHAIGGALKIAGDNVELDDKTFAASADLRRHFELIPPAQKAALAKTEEELAAEKAVKEAADKAKADAKAEKEAEKAAAKAKADADKAAAKTEKDAAKADKA